MNRPILIGYQLLIGLSDTMTGALLMIAPAFTLGLMRLHAPCRCHALPVFHRLFCSLCRAVVPLWARG
jgi:hypothetical protein